MGQLRFRISDRDRIETGGIGRIYVAGPEEIPWPTQAHWEGDLLVVQRSVHESGSVYVPWRVDGHGGYMLTSATLMERDEPYLLDVELARGLIQRIRTRLFTWEWLGLQTPCLLKERLSDATIHFSQAATSQQEPDKAAADANQALSLAIDTAERLVASYSQQALAAQQQQAPIATLMGVSLDPETPVVGIRRSLVEAANIIQLPVAWKAIEHKEGNLDWKATDEQLAWCQKAGLKVAAGPLLLMDDRGMPDWMVLWEGDFENLSRLMIDHVRTVVQRYVGRVHLWHVASRVNVGKMLQLEEEQRLQLVAQALQVVREIDPRTPTVVSFDQPWGEYLTDQHQDLAPIHYADALVRADLGVSGFGLEINAGYHPGGTWHRPSFEYGRLMDQWTQIGLPLMLMISTASSDEEDPHAQRNSEARLLQSDSDQPQDPQLGWAASLLPLLLARTTVQVVLWNQLTDAAPHEFPHAGLFDSQDKPKPIVNLLRDLRKSCLM